MSVLQPVQPVGLNTDFIRDHQTVFDIQVGLTGEDTVTFEDGTPFLSIQRELMSSRHRMHFVDLRTDSKLFEMEKERFASDYSAEHPDGSGHSLFDIQIDAAFMGGPTCSIQFSNVANGGSPAAFELKVHTFDSIQTITWEGQPVAEYEKSTLSSHSSLRVAPYVDPLPIIALEIAIIDRTRQQRRRRMN